MTRAVLFDMGNVLIHFSHDRMYQQIGKLVGKSGSEVRGLCERAGWLTSCDVRPLTDDQLALELGSVLGAPLDPALLWRAVSDIFWQNPSIEPIVARLARLGVPMVLLSNTCSAHMRWVSGRFKVLDFFVRKILSYEVGAAKPSPVIFTAAVRAAGCSPGECLFIDDTSSHVEAARRLGFDAVCYENCEMLLRDLQTRLAGQLFS